MWQADCGIHARGFIHLRARGVPSMCARKFQYTCMRRLTRMDMCMCVRGYSLGELSGGLLSEPLDIPRESLESPQRLPQGLSKRLR